MSVEIVLSNDPKCSECDSPMEWVGKWSDKYLTFYYCSECDTEETKEWRCHQGIIAQ